MSVPTNLIPTKITGLPEYTGNSTLGYFPYVLEGRTYQVQFANLAAVGAVPSTRVVAAGTGLTGGGDLSQDRVIAIANGGVGYSQLANSGVTAGSYGSGSQIPVLTIDDKGRVTSASSVSVTISGYVPDTRRVDTDASLIGGGPLSSNLTLGVNYSASLPQALGTASAGVSTAAARGDHVHPAVNLSDATQTQGALPLGRGGTGDALSPVAGAVVYSTGTKFALADPGLPGQVLVSAGTGEPYWLTVSGTGTVTSVAASGGTTGMTFSGSPITAAGTITLGGTLEVANGGTGATTLTGIVKGNGTSAFTAAASADVISTLGYTPGNLAGNNTWSGTNTFNGNVSGTGTISISNTVSGNRIGCLVVDYGGANSPALRSFADTVTLGTGFITVGSRLSFDSSTTSELGSASTSTTGMKFTARRANTPLTFQTAPVTNDTLVTAMTIAGSGDVTTEKALNVKGALDVTSTATFNAAIGLAGANYGTAGQFLTSQGSGVAPSWTNLTSGQVTTALGYTPYNGATNPNGYITGNQTITFSGDATGSGTTAVALTLATQAGLSGGTYNNVTVNTKGLVTAASNVSYLTAESDTLGTVTGRGASTSTAVTFSGGATVGGAGITYNGSTSGTTVLKAAAAAGTTTITMPAATGTMALTSDLPTVNNGTLTLSIGAAAATNNTVTVGTGTGFSANTGTNATYSLSIGPALTALASTMTGATTGFLKKSAADTYTLDTSTYLTANQTVTLSGDVTGSGSTAITATLSNSGVTAGTYNNVTVNTKGLVTAASNVSYLTGNQTITVSGDASGSGTTAISLTLANSGVTAGTYTKVTVDAKGRVTTGASIATADLPTSINSSTSITESGTISATTLGFRGIPQNSQTAAYTLALTDAGKHISITTGGVTIPANASVAFPIGTAITIFNDSASTQTIAITTDTLRQAGTTNTGTRTLAVYGVATILKVTSTVWVISGNVT